MPNTIKNEFSADEERAMRQYAREKRAVATQSPPQYRISPPENDEKLLRELDALPLKQPPYEE
jgi:hypothetical protein